MPQLSAALIDEVRVHLTERWQSHFLQHWSDLPNLVTGVLFSGAGREDGFHRPLQMLLLFFTYQAFGLSAPAFHFVNVALHAVNACLVYRLGCQIGLRRWSSFSAALLWAVHPLLTELYTPLFKSLCIITGLPKRWR